MSERKRRGCAWIGDHAQSLQRLLRNRRQRILSENSQDFDTFCALQPASSLDHGELHIGRLEAELAKIFQGDHPIRPGLDQSLAQRVKRHFFGRAQAGIHRFVRLHVQKALEDGDGSHAGLTWQRSVARGRAQGRDDFVLRQERGEVPQPSAQLRIGGIEHS